MASTAPSDEDATYTLAVRDDSKVCQWRFDRLLRLGVDAVDAARLAQIRDVEHTVEGLIAAGCPAHVAVRIVG